MKRTNDAKLDQCCIILCKFLCTRECIW